jgi:hypothetical protein
MIFDFTKKEKIIFIIDNSKETNRLIKVKISKKFFGSTSKHIPDVLVVVAIENIHIDASNKNVILVKSFMMFLIILCKNTNRLIHQSHHLIPPAGVSCKTPANLLLFVYSYKTSTLYCPTPAT